MSFSKLPSTASHRSISLPGLLAWLLSDNSAGLSLSLLDLREEEERY